MPLVVAMFQIATSSARCTATLALRGPRRGAIRRYLGGREVSGVWEIDIAAVPRAPCRYGVPGRVRRDLTLPADSLLPGVVPAHDARCCAVGNLGMSAPVSAPTTSGVSPPIPGIGQIMPGTRLN